MRKVVETAKRFLKKKATIGELRTAVKESEVCNASGNVMVKMFQCSCIEDWNETVEQARENGERLCAWSNGNGCVWTCIVTEDSPEQLAGV